MMILILPWQKFYLGTVKLKFVKSIGVYTIVNILDKTVPFLMLPILTRYLSPEEFGIIAMFLVFISFIFPFVGLNIHGAVTRQYIDKEKIDIASYVTNALYILVVTSFILYLLLYMFDTLILTYFHINSQWFLVIILITISMVISEIILNIYNISHRPIHYGIFRILRTLTSYAFIFTFVILLSKGWKGRVQGQFYGEIIFAIIGLIILSHSKLIRFGINIDHIKSTLKFGVPLIPHAFGAVIISMSDRLLITNMVGIDATGIYVVAVQISVIISVVIGSIKQAWAPHFFDKIKINTNESKRELVKFTYIIFIFIFLITLIFSFIIQPLIPYIVDERFHESKNYINWLIYGITFQGVYHLFTNYIFYARKTYILMLLTFFVSALNIVISYYLIKLNGPLGAAQGTFIAYSITAIIVLYISNKILPMPWNVFKWKNYYNA